MFRSIPLPTTKPLNTPLLQQYEEKLALLKIFASKDAERNMADDFACFNDILERCQKNYNDNHAHLLQQALKMMESLIALQTASIGYESTHNEWYAKGREAWSNGINFAQILLTQFAVDSAKANFIYSTLNPRYAINQFRDTVTDAARVMKNPNSNTGTTLLNSSKKLAELTAGSLGPLPGPRKERLLQGFLGALAFLGGIALYAGAIITMSAFPGIGLLPGIPMLLLGIAAITTGFVGLLEAIAPSNGPIARRYNHHDTNFYSSPSKLNISAKVTTDSLTHLAKMAKHSATLFSSKGAKSEKENKQEAINHSVPAL